MLATARGGREQIGRTSPPVALAISAPSNTTPPSESLHGFGPGPEYTPAGGGDLILARLSLREVGANALQPGLRQCDDAMLDGDADHADADDAAAIVTQK